MWTVNSFKQLTDLQRVKFYKKVSKECVANEKVFYKFKLTVNPTYFN